MIQDFSQLKKARKSQFDELSDKLNKLNKPAYTNDDDGCWKPTVDKSGNGFAIIRFLPAPPNENVPFVRYWDHGFKGPGGWYIEKSRTSINEPDPLGEYNSKLWDSGIEANKEIARNQKRRLHFVSNILIISNPSNPDDEGKVFPYIYGKKIFDKINDSMNPPPEFPDTTPMNPFDMWEGANFKIKIRTVKQFRNYDLSGFDSPSVIFEDEDKMEELWKNLPSLEAFVDPEKFKSYDDLKARLQKVLGSLEAEKEVENEMPQEKEANWEEKSVESKVVDSNDDDDDLAFFDNLMKD